MIEFACTSCGKKLKAPDNFAGKRAKCKGCGKAVQVPDSLEEPETDDSEVAASLLREALAPPAMQEAAVVASPQKLVACESCGSVTNADTRRCAQCGHVLGKPVRSAAAAMETVEPRTAHAPAVDTSEMMRGVIGACVGGGLGGLVWAAVCYFTGYEVGWIAWGVGALAGFGATAASGTTGGGIATAGALGAVLGLVIGKVGTVMAFGASAEEVGAIVGPYDILWCLLAIGTAVKMGAGGGEAQTE